MLRHPIVVAAVSSLLAIGVAVLDAGAASDTASRTQVVPQHRAQEAARVREQYGLLFQRLALTPRQQDQFVDVMAAERTRGADPDMAATSARMRGDFSTSQDTMRRLAEIIGPDRLPAFVQYEKQFREHVRARQLGAKLEAISLPLTDEQRDQLTQILATERERVPSPTRDSKLQTFEDLEAYLNWQTDFDSRVFTATTAVLSQAQRAFLEEHFKVRVLERAIALEKQRNGSPLGLWWYPPE